MDDFKAGSLVELKSGGPVMVVGEVLYRRRQGEAGGTKLSCGWFGESAAGTLRGHKFRTGEFPPECVRRSEGQVRS